MVLRCHDVTASRCHDNVASHCHGNLTSPSGSLAWQRASRDVAQPCRRSLEGRMPIPGDAAAAAKGKINI
ncbi:hypothetical protein FKM82_007996 [Ascaphus truei]